MSRSGSATSATAHADVLTRGTAARPERAQHSLLQLQRHYGNQYVQRVLAVARQGEGEAEVTPAVEQAIQHARGGGQALPSTVRVQMESAFHANFGDVRVHTDGTADALNRALQARAFTTGHDIFFRQSEYNPGDSSGRSLLAHELTHVVQQRGAIQTKLMVGAVGDQYEQEADRMAQQVTAMTPPVLQRKCACGGTPGPSGECEQCRQKRLAMQEQVNNLPETVMAQPALQSLLRLFRTAGGAAHMGLHEQDPVTAGTEPDIEFLYANGTTTCVFPGGTASVTISNSGCSRPCTVRHEGVHASDIGPCCTAAGAAYRAATTDSDRNSVRSRFFGWMSSNRNWFECRGYAESVRCADEMITAKNCASPAAADAACCSDLTSYRASMEASRVSNCASAGAALSACPFP